MQNNKCYFTSCQDPEVIGQWINSKNEYLPVCEHHLGMLQMVYDYEMMDEGLYKALPSEDEIVDEGD